MANYKEKADSEILTSVKIDPKTIPKLNIKNLQSEESKKK
jgi:hypothetical protein